MDAPPDEFVVIDEFYTAYRGARETTRQEFESWLERQNGVCVVGRPREVDWLLNNEETALSSSFLDAFDEVVCLGYHPEAHRERAIECCRSILEDLDAELPADEAIDEALDTLCRTTEYEFESVALRERLDIGGYDATLVPALVVYFSDRLADGGGAIVPDVVREVLQDASFSEFYDEVRDACAGLFSRETLSELGSIVSDAASDPGATAENGLAAVSTAGLGVAGTALGSTGLAAGGGLALYLALRDDDENELSRGAVFEVLLSDDLTPTAEAELEAELDLPPRTISNFRRLVTGGTVEQLLEHRERLEAELDGVEDRLVEIESAVEQYDEDLQKLSELLATLEDEAVDHTDIAAYVATSIAEATGNIEDFEQRLLQEDEDILQVGSIDGIPPYFGDEPETIVESILEDDANLIILKGSHGTGKSTAAYRVCRSLSAQGYDVVLPNVRTSSPEAIEYSLTAGTSESVVFTAYMHGVNDDNTFREFSWVRQLLTWLRDGYCSTVIIECRSELFESLKSFEEDIEDLYRSQLWKNRTDHELQRLSDAHIEKIVRWVLAELDADADNEEIINEAIDLAEGNPEIAKIAARFALVGDKPLRDVTSYDELVWLDINRLVPLTRESSDPPPIVRKIFQYVAVLRRVTTQELAELVDTDKETLKKQAEAYLIDYLGGDLREKLETEADAGEDRGVPSLEDDTDESSTVESDDVWTISPDIYAEVVFREGCLRGRMQDDVLTHYLDRVDQIGNDHRYRGIAENLAIAYQHARDIDDEAVREVELDDVRYDCHVLLKKLYRTDAAPYLYVACLERFAISWVPVAPEYLEADITKLVTGFGQRGELRDDELDGTSLAMNSLARFYENHLDFGSDDQLGSLSGVNGQIAQAYDRLEGENASKFLANVYLMTLSNLANHHPDPGGVDPWVDEIERRAQLATDSQYHNLPPGQFLANVYSMTLWSLANHHPDPGNVEAWIDEIEHRAQLAADSQYHDLPPSQFLANVYSMTLSNLADQHSDPGSVEAWVNDIEHRVQVAAHSQYHEKPPGRFIITSVAMALSHVLKTSSPVPHNWYPYLIRDTLTSLEVDTLPEFCRTHERILSQNGQSFPQMHVHLAVTTLAIAVNDWPDDDHEERIARVGTVLATIVHQIWQETMLSGEYFEKLVEVVERVQDDDPELYDAAVESVPELLDEEHDNLIAGLDWQEAFR